MSDCAVRQTKNQSLWIPYGKQTVKKPFQHGIKRNITYWKQSNIRKNAYVLVTADNRNDPWN